MSSNKNPFVRFKNVSARATSGYVIGQVSQDRRRMNLVAAVPALQQMGFGATGIDYFNPNPNIPPEAGSFTQVDNAASCPNSTFAILGNNDGMAMTIKPSAGDFGTSAFVAEDGYPKNRLDTGCCLLAEQPILVTPFVIQVMFTWNIWSDRDWVFGLYERNSTSQNVIAGCLAGIDNSQAGWAGPLLTDLNTVQYYAVDGSGVTANEAPVTIRMTNDGTKTEWHAACDGRNFLPIFSRPNNHVQFSNGFSGPGPDKMGLVLKAMQGTGNTQLDGAGISLQIWDYH